MLVRLGGLVRTRDGHALPLATAVEERQSSPAGDNLLVGIVGRNPLLEVGAGSASGHIHLGKVGDINHRAHADIVLHERDVDREFVVTLEEFYRSVERVDQPEELPVAALLVAQFAPLLAQNRYPRGAEVLADGLVGQPVGQRDGGSVALEAHLIRRAVLVDLHDGCPGPHRRIEQRREQELPLLVVYHRSSCFCSILIAGIKVATIYDIVKFFTINSTHTVHSSGHRRSRPLPVFS